MIMMVVVTTRDNEFNYTFADKQDVGESSFWRFEEEGNESFWGVNLIGRSGWSVNDADDDGDDEEDDAGTDAICKNI